jgi:rod shape-determining protein MreC
VIISGVIVLITVNIIVLSATTKSSTAFGLGHIGMSFVAPFQELVTRSVRFARDIWEHYFYLIAVSHENLELKQSLNQAIENNNQWHEVELANNRLRSLLSFQATTSERVIAAEVIGKDPSAWFKTIIVDKGSSDGLERGLPVVIAQWMLWYSAAGRAVLSKAHLKTNAASSMCCKNMTCRSVIRLWPRDLTGCIPRGCESDGCLML